MLFLSDVSTFDWKETIFMVVGGLGIFLYGINLMGDSLKDIAGNRLKKIIEVSTNTPLKGIFVGIIATALIQSSSGTTAIVISLVSAGLMTLPQSVGVILGANIGTTITAVLVGLKIKAYALPIMAVGSGLIFFFSKKKFKQIGKVLLGFGMLFYGLDIMGSALKQLQYFSWFNSALQSTGDNPILGLFVGTGLTALVQSSSVTVAIVQDLYASASIPLAGAIAIVLGNNIGTTITSVIAAIGGSTSAKRASVIHVLFNVIGSVIFFILLVPYTAFISWLELTFLNGVADENTIMFAHLSFNVVNTVIMYIFIKQLVWAAVKIIPSKNDEEERLQNLDWLEEDLLVTAPTLALESAKKVINNMTIIVNNMLRDTINYSLDIDKSVGKKVFVSEEYIDTMDQKTHDYLVKLAQSDLSETTAQLHASYVDTIRDLERIGDHCVNLVEFFDYRYEHKMLLSDEAKTDLSKLYKQISQMVELTCQSFVEYDKELCVKVMELEEKIDKLVVKYRKRHIKRMNDAAFKEKQDGFYVDILSNVERIGDHCNNIVTNIAQDYYFSDEILFDD